MTTIAQATALHAVLEAARDPLDLLAAAEAILQVHGPMFWASAQDRREEAMNPRHARRWAQAMQAQWEVPE